ncbi:YbaB/EbfC family nucleoid-associated protein [Nocardia sp. SYP-A9097]|uniref:YbaB/EbfC family nucleoid-associated protein n=1 Tax=Nocardia sp. SYP-A9097 TaxID=2663237 RepID=UPI001891A0CE|nr:YbaB/EbfC family nucleoid-associated protein [Nocardia sp. SYP-A9097]
MKNDSIAARNERIVNAVAQVRGRAQTSGGAVVVETDAYGTITDLQISPAAMTVDGSRLAKAIAQCHQTARDQANTEANRIYAELMNISASSTPDPSGNTPEWEDPAPIRITHVV